MWYYGTYFGKILMSTDNRPVFLELHKISLPITALVSILHRISGVLMLLSLPILTYVFYLSMSSQEGYAIWSELYSHNLMVRLVIFGMYAAFSYHVFAGIRHMVHDFSHQHALDFSIRTSQITLITWGLQALVMGYVILGGII